MPGKQPTLADLRAQREAQQGKLAEREVEREDLEARIPMLIAEHTGSGVGAFAERERLAKLAEESRALSTAIAALSSRIQQAENAEQNARHAVLVDVAAKAGSALEERAIALQRAVDSVCALALAVQDADREFAVAVSNLPREYRSDDFMSREFSSNLGQLICLRLHANSDARVKARGVFESPFELKKHGTAEIVRKVRDYVGIALKQAPRGRVESTPPGAA